LLYSYYANKLFSLRINFSTYEWTLMSYCTVFCDVRFLFTYRRNAHVLLYCVLWSSVPLYIQKERSCIIVLCFVRFGSSLSKEGTLLSDCTVFCRGTEFHKTQYNNTWSFVLYVKRNRTSQNTVQSDRSVPSLDKEEPVLLYCVLWSSFHLYSQKKRSCVIVLCFVKFGSSLPTEGT
jgi:hypothetical protein